MTYSLQIDDRLLDEAIAIGGELQVDRLVELALREYIDRRRRLQVVDLFGTIDYVADHDYKVQRQL